ncbi:MAG: 30S ribosomal protein S12 methylthiotransferase RimO [Candidatus Omnitrophota bacterium]|nr:MAG: 30S ribosomal protein S12 methylthiotransferase RimO [Candidatus Omnitrophota bacterium]
MKASIGIISHGCPRNMVDSEVMLGALKKEGYSIKEEIGNCDIAIINTCAFIEDAKQEAIDAILQAAELKKEGKIKAIIVTGCLSQRYYKVLEKQIPEIDAFLGASDFDKITKAVKDVSEGKKPIIVSHPTKIYSHTSPRFLLTPNYYTYIKIAEGCNNRCSYCVIYKIRGKYRSRPIESILKEVENITENKKISELNIIAQDTTSYGIDIYGKYKLAKLLERVATLNKVHWIRLLYTHPRHFSDELIQIIGEKKSICKYIDLPIQHASNRILKKMNRRITKSQMQKLIDKIRRKIPDVALRTSVIVGFPGETDKEFKQLLNFIKQIKFERLGAFIYSKEENTPAYKYKNQIPDAIRRQRLDEIMKLQQGISEQINKSWMNKILEVLIEEKQKNALPAGRQDYYIGRSQYDAPEVDGVVYVKAKRAKPGDFLKTRITDTLEYDLIGEAI